LRPLRKLLRALRLIFILQFSKTEPYLKIGKSRKAKKFEIEISLIKFRIFTGFKTKYNG